MTRRAGSRRRSATIRGRRASTVLRAPAVLTIPTTAALALLLLPLAALVMRAPWAALPRIVDSAVVGDALRLSLGCATAAAAVSVLLGVPLAWFLARSDSRVAPVLRALVTVPLVLPPVAGGVALLLAFGRFGVVGGPINAATGWSLPFTTTGVVVAQTFVAMPFLVLTVDGALRSTPPGYEEAAATLGASTWRTFRTVTLPLVAPAVVAGTALSWARALGEFGATMTFAGSFPGRTQTMPVAVYLVLEHDPEAAIALSLLLLTACVLVLLALRTRWDGSLRRDRDDR